MTCLVRVTRLEANYAMVRPYFCGKVYDSVCQNVGVQLCSFADATFDRRFRAQRLFYHVIVFSSRS